MTRTIKAFDTEWTVDMDMWKEMLGCDGDILDELKTDEDFTEFVEEDWGSYSTWADEPYTKDIG